MNPVAYESVEPCPELRPFVRRLIVAHESGLENAVMQCIPTGSNYLGWLYGGEFSVTSKHQTSQRFRGLTFCGQIENRELEINVLGRVSHVMVEFTATGLYRLTGVRGATIHGRAVEMEQLSPKQHSRLTDCLNTSLVDMEGNVRALEQALLTLVEDALPEIDYLQYAANKIELADGRIKVSGLGNEAGISQRQLSRKYKDIVGIGPKFHAKVQQANTAFSHLVTGDIESLTEIADICGYSDQAHFARAIREIVKLTPRMVLPKSPVEIIEFMRGLRRSGKMA